MLAVYFAAVLGFNGCVLQSIPSCAVVDEVMVEGVAVCKCTACVDHYQVGVDGTSCDPIPCSMAAAGRLCRSVAGSMPNCYCSNCPAQMVPCHGANSTSCCDDVWCGNAISDPGTQACSDQADNPVERALPEHANHTGACVCHQNWKCESNRCIKEVLGCRSVANLPYQTCVPYADIVNSVCTCRSGHTCETGGTCRSTRCQHSIYGCDIYTNEKEIGGSCTCAACHPTFVLYGNKCHPRLKCNEASTNLFQCPPHTVIADGMCTCSPLYHCTEGTCVSKAVKQCDMAVDPASEQCAQDMQNIDGTCRCLSHLKCYPDMTCKREIVNCGDTITESYQQCPEWLHEVDGKCQCKAMYSCGQDNQCVLSECGGDVIPRCEIYLYTAPENGICICRKCQDNTFLFEGQCTTVLRESPSPSNNGAGIIKLGLLHSVTGNENQFETTMLKAEMMAVGELNAAGGITGKTVTAVVADGASSVATFAEQAEKLISVDDVAAIVGCSSTQCQEAVLKVAKARQIPFWFPSSYQGQICDEALFSTGNLPNQFLYPALTWASNVIGESFFIVKGSDTYSDTLHELSSKVLLSKLKGFAVLEDSSTAAMIQTEVTETIQLVMPNGGVLLNFLNPTASKGLFEGISKFEQGGKYRILSTRVYEDDIAYIGASYVVGHYTVASYFDSLSNSGNNVFRDAYYGSGATLNNDFTTTQAFESLKGLHASEKAENAYLAVHLWARTVQAAGTPDLSGVAYTQEHTVPSHTGTSATLIDNHHVKREIRIGKALADGTFQVIQTGLSTKPQVNSDYVSHESLLCSFVDRSIHFCGVMKTSGSSTCTPYSVKDNGYCTCVVGYTCSRHGRCIKKARKCNETLQHEAEYCRFWGSSAVGSRCMCGEGLECTSDGCVSDRSKAGDLFVAGLCLQGVNYVDLVDMDRPTILMGTLVAEVTNHIIAAIGISRERIGLRKVCNVGILRSEYDCVYVGDMASEGIAFSTASREATPLAFPSSSTSGVFSFSSSAKTRFEFSIIGEEYVATAFKDRYIPGVVIGHNAVFSSSTWMRENAYPIDHPFVQGH